MYHVNVITRGGCKAADSTYVIMKGFDVNPRPDTAICKGGTVQVNAGVNGTSYEWDPKDGLSNVAIANPVASPVTTTNYTVKVTDTSGCSNTGKLKISIINSVAVKVAFSAPAYVCRSVDTASFQAQTSGDIISWHWDFGNGAKSMSPTPPVQKYFISGNTNSYRVSLMVADSAGCTDTAERVIKVADNCYITVASAFSPNGDGLNDYLYPLNAYKARELVFQVFNRSGRLLFETKDWTVKWDGTYKGEPQPAGNFVWTLRYKDEAGKPIALKGSAILIR